MPITIVQLVSLMPTHRLFQVDVEGTHIIVTVTDEAWVVNDWIKTSDTIRQYYNSRLVVGLGVRWNPGDVGAPAETLHLCVGYRCLVYQLGRSRDVPDSLREFLRNPDNTFVGFWNHLDQRKLQNSIHCLEMWRPPLNIRDYARTADGSRSLQNASIWEIIEECLGIPGVRMIRDVSMSNWGAQHLSADQVLQATLYAHCAFQIGRNIVRPLETSVNPN